MNLLAKITGLLMLTLFLSNPIQAQKTIKEGVIKFEVTDVKSESPEAMMMKGSTMDLYFNKKMQKVEMSMMGGLLNFQTITDLKADENTMLTDIMGRKIKVVQDPKDKKDEEKGEEYTFEYDKSDKKTIAGYKCHKVEMSNKNGEKILAYITKKIKPTASYFDKMFKGLDGFPLEYVIQVPDMSMTYSAIEILSKVKKDSFNIPDGYEEMTPEEFKKEMGSMDMGF